ncbi:MAG: ECF transporter S component [Anaerolineae bacterium]
MTEARRVRGGWAIMIGGAILGIAAVVVYWFASHEKNAWVTWNGINAVVLAAIGVIAGVAIASSAEIRRWTTWESILAAVLGGVIGVLFWLWGLFWELLEVIKAGIPGYGYAVRDLFYGFWFLAAILVPYILRRPGAALAAEMVGAIISSLLGSQWGLTVLISGLAQGGLAEVVFALRGYKHYDLPTLIAASAGAALGSWVVDYAFWYNTLDVLIVILMLIARVISAAVLSGLLGKVLSDALAATGVLDNTALGRARIRG